VSNVVKLRGFATETPMHCSQLDNGFFGNWYFDIDTYEREPSDAELAWLPKQARKQFDDGDLIPLKVKVTACMNDKGMGVASADIWATLNEVATRGYINQPKVTETQREAINVSFDWLADTLGMMGFSKARRDVQERANYR